jgi:hypothetical protein
MINIPRELIELIIFIPIIATLISIGRYLLGLKTLSIYAPIILAIGLKLTGLKYGLIITAFVIIVSIIGHELLKRIRMHYITRVATNYIILASALLVTFLMLSILPIKIDFIKDINPIGLILIATLSDSFIKMYVKKNLISSIRSLLETLIISVAGWYIITSPNIINWIISNIWIIALLIIINLLLGQYTGFRLKEVFRFGGVKKDDRTK